ncbi:MAG: amino acid ABC transporter ATP-binding protein [Nitrososphaerota archaeon]|nr:amino acid ABC transporter ATP-binding protein [Candidatus Geocrenenecus dongiae]
MVEDEIVLKVEDLYKSYNNVIVLKGISFEVRRGETKIICGPSGSGKSTLLRCINLLTKPDKGMIWLEGEELTTRSININKVRQKIGFVFQEFNLFNHLTALRNVSIGLEVVKKMKREEAYKRAMEVLRKVGLEEHAHKYPAELSGGQKQRVAIARALAMNPSIILYDEPTSALDPQLIGEVLEVMKALAREKVTSIVVTHEMGFAQSVGDEMLFMYDGKIIERGPPEEVIHNPKTEIAKKFFERIQELYGREKR